MMWLKAAPYLAAIAAAGIAYGSWEWRGRTIDKLEGEVSRLSNNLAACGKRYSAMIRDKERDDEIDNLSPDDLRDVPPEWLLPPGAD